MIPPLLSPRRVLVVDGHADAADSLADLLCICGHEARSAHTAAAAFAAMPAFAPDIVFLSLRLLVALTGYGRLEDQSAAKAAGFDHFLLKPADPDAILALLG